MLIKSHFITDRPLCLLKVTSLLPSVMFSKSHFITVCVAGISLRAVYRAGRRGRRAVGNNGIFRRPGVATCETCVITIYVICL